MTEEFIISTVAPHLSQPIADQVEALIQRTFRPGDWISAGFYESGYSASIILLTCATLESLTQRDRYFLMQKRPGARCESNIANYARVNLKYRRYRHLGELFDVRNAIAHNHMWEVSYVLKPRGGRQHRRTRLVEGSHRLSDPPNPLTRVPRSARIGMRLVPSTLDRTDVIKALRASIHFLDHLGGKGTNPVKFADEIIVLRGERLELRRLPDILEEST